MLQHRRNGRSRLLCDCETPLNRERENGAQEIVLSGGCSIAPTTANNLS
jgi:hypothetical protein